MVGGLGDAEVYKDLGGRPAGGQFGVGVAEIAEDRLGG
jgi:hypothetical protein